MDFSKENQLSILKITDSRFQDDLIKEAKHHGKLAQPDIKAMVSAISG